MEGAKEKTEQSIFQTQPIFASHRGRVAGTDEEIGQSTFAIVSHSFTSGPLFARHRHRLLFCGLCVAIVLLLGVVAVVLAFTVFRVQDPTLAMNNVFLADVQFSGDGSSSDPQFVNATVVADISVRNPNVAPLRFGNSVTVFYVEGREVGSGLVAGSRVGEKETARMNVTARVVAAAAASAGVRGGMLAVRSRTNVVGRVSVLGIFKRDVGVAMGCNMTFDSSRPTEAVAAVSRYCFADVK